MSGCWTAGCFVQEEYQYRCWGWSGRRHTLIVNIWQSGSSRRHLIQDLSFLLWKFCLYKCVLKPWRGAFLQPKLLGRADLNEVEIEIDSRGFTDLQNSMLSLIKSWLCSKLEKEIISCIQYLCGLVKHARCVIVKNCWYPDIEFGLCRKQLVHHWFSVSHCLQLLAASMRPSVFAWMQRMTVRKKIF